jgi:hypothetical protein
MITQFRHVTLVTILSVGVAGAGAAQTPAQSVSALPAGATAAPVHVASGEALDRLVASDVARQDADRQAIRDLLLRSDVREVASQAGLDIRKAEAAVSTLSGKDLQEAAAHARMAQEQLGGGSSVTITTTTLIIILLVVILLIVALK